MSLSDLASLGSFVSGVAVLVSLIYLALQVRQAEKNQRAAIRQGRADRTAAIVLAAANPGLAEDLVRAIIGAPDLTQKQLFQFGRYCFAMLNNYEDNFSQNRDGLLTDSAFATVVSTMEQAFRLPSFRVQWKRLRGSFEGEFAEFLDRLIARTPVEQPSFNVAEWLRDRAAERSDAH